MNEAWGFSPVIRAPCAYIYIYLYIYIYIYTIAILCIYMHRVSGTNCQVDATVMLTWSKVCITKNCHKTVTLYIKKLSSTVNHTIQKLSCVGNCSDLWGTDHICGKLVSLMVRFVENWSELWKTGQMCGHWSDVWETGQMYIGRIACT